MLLLGGISKARVTQIMNLLNLAPDIQEQLLFLPPTTRRRDKMGNDTCERLQRWSIGANREELFHAVGADSGNRGTAPVKIHDA